ncbi:dienelactone hydrolase family protein [Parasphingopyxis sp.]|uniref:dienelactone hydrolase family protein n=1 Tax=Parasphingopyxis sp. TaxID=1920299 RepID=UPI0026378B34|nr:dienelactone hydrolase family protein [Parasphingopyxis sp.]
MTALNAKIATDDGEMGAYVAQPSETPSGAVVLLQEIFGVNAAMRAAADDLATDGFLVVAPDLFWRQEPGVDLGYSDEERGRGFQLMQGLDFQKAIGDCIAAMNFARDHEASNGKVAYLGFCLGGKLSVLAASNSAADACVSFYGVKLEDNHEQLKNLSCPFQMHVGTQDEHVPIDVAEGIEALLANEDEKSVFLYEGAQHGFFNKRRDDVFDARAYETANRRVSEFLGQNLK